jgi:DNA repair exonuclease SbcCD nuclease subunit
MPADLPRILLTHWSVSGSTSSSGAPVDLFREVVLPIGELEEIGFEAIVAGHIHRPQMLGERGFYVGSPMPLNFGEAGHDHTVTLLDVEGTRETIHRFQAFQIPVPSRRLVNVELDLRERDPSDGPPSGWLETDVADAIVKVKIRGPEERFQKVSLSGIRDGLLANGARKVWAIQSEIERAELVRGVAVDETLGDVEAMELYLEAEGIEGDRLEGLLERHVNYLERIGR